MREIQWEWKFNAIENQCDPNSKLSKLNSLPQDRGRP